MGRINNAQQQGIPRPPRARVNGSRVTNAQCSRQLRPEHVLGARTRQHFRQARRDGGQVGRGGERPHEDALGAVVDAEHRHCDLLVRRWRLFPESRVAKGLRRAPEDFWREAELGLVGGVGV